MSNEREYTPPSPAMPDDYDRTLGMLQGAQLVTHTKPSMIRTTPPLGIGGSTTYAITTYREAGDVIEEKEDGSARREPATFTVFLEVGKGSELKRIVIPHDVIALILRQRDSLTLSAQRRQGKHTAARLKARGFVPTPPKRRKAAKA